MLNVRQLSTGYPGVPVVHDVNLCVGAREIVAVFGHNGAGKSTLLKGLFGLLPETRAAEVRFCDQRVQGLSPKALTRLGMALVPQGQGVFPRLTVGENLRLGLWAAGVDDRSPEGERRLERVFTHLPVLRERWRERAGNLSGGQQQMVSIGRALVAQPTLLLLDEPSIGLWPKMVEETMQLVRSLRDEAGISVILVEQNVRQALTVADRVYVMKSGRIIREATPDELGDARELWALF